MSESTGNGRKLIAFVGISIINFMAMFLISGVGVYGYTVAGTFDAIASVGMIFTLESAARCIMMPLSGKIGDRLGLKKVFLFAVAVYTIFYAIAAFATNFWMFTIARMITGFAWGLFVTNILVLISHTFGPESGPKYTGIAQALATVGMIIAAPLAGIFCAINWRMEFFIAIPILVIGFILCAIGIPSIPKADTKGARMDIGGCIATVVALFPFCLAMNFGNSMGWGSPLVIGLIVLVVIGVILLVIFEKKAADPIYPAKLLFNKFYLSIFMVSLLYSIANATANYMPTYAQSLLGASSTIAGMLTTPSLIIATILSVVLGNVAAKTGKYKGMTMAWAICAVISGIVYLFINPMAVRNPGFTIVLIIIAMTPMGAVNGVQQIVPYTYPMKVLKPEEIAGGMAFMGLGGVLGNTISNGVLGALMNTSGGLGTILYVPIFCAVIMLVFAFLFRDIRSGETI